MSQHNSGGDNWIATSEPPKQEGPVWVGWKDGDYEQGRYENFQFKDKIGWIYMEAPDYWHPLILPTPPPKS